MDRRVYHIERVDHEGRRCNDCNNPVEPGDPDASECRYQSEIAKTRLEHYADMIGYPYRYVYRFTEAEAAVLMDAAPSGYITGRPCSTLAEELAAVAQRLATVVPFADSCPESCRESCPESCPESYPDSPLDDSNCNMLISHAEYPPHGWFMRMSGCSPKDGLPHYPVKSAVDAVSKLATSKRALIGLRNGDRLLYFAPYDPTWDESRELRVFVRRGRVTAISQYVWSRRWLFWGLSDDELQRAARDCVEYVESALTPVLDAIGTRDVTCDVYWQDDESFRIIELNSYGYWLGAGAALFHWIDDRDKLYGVTDCVYFRVHI